MHELPVTESILCMVLDEAKAVRAKKVTQIDMTVGQLTGILPECVQFQFQVISQHTIAADAELVFNRPPGRIHCHKCDITFISEGFNDLRCPSCRNLQINILQGRELTLDSIEWE